MRRPDADGKSSDGIKGLAEDPFFEGRDPIWDYLTSEQYDDGTPREKSTLSLMVNKDGFRLALNDADNRRGLYTQGRSVDECMMLMSEALADGTARWYSWGERKKKKA